MALPMCFNSVKQDYHFRGKTSDTIVFRGKTSDTIAKSNFGFYTKSIKYDFGAYCLFILCSENYQTQPNQANRLQTFPYFESLK